MKKGLLKEAIIKIISGIVLMGVLLFVPAWDLRWKNGWILMAVLFVPMFFAGIVMYVKVPDLLRSRLNAKETQSEQKDVIRYSGLMFIAAFVAAGLDHHFGWTQAPEAVTWVAAAVFLLAYCLFGEVLRENRYLSRTIEVQENQTVVDTGLYGIVRHPMYSATLFLFLSMPLILGSLPSFIIMLAYIPIIAKRIGNEETVLEAELKGYAEYRKKVKYRLIPLIW
ncbi:MAG: isoprenylcysteine carboxylmethyltransferase family protein [Clostridiales bacterium]|nr:isoprenylcysteine carboxylmethyltransferase family protein [Clostridiales bacterium]